MKKYVLVIDTSASSPENTLYVSYSNTVKELKTTLAGLGLTFAPKYIYCATIAKKLAGERNRYKDIQRTDNGIKWYKDNDFGKLAFQPEDWTNINEWKTIAQFRNSQQ